MLKRLKAERISDGSDATIGPGKGQTKGSSFSIKSAIGSQWTLHEDAACGKLPIEGGKIAMKKPSQSAGQLMELINHAIQDCEITPKEYNELMDLAHADSHLDKEEKQAGSRVSPIEPVGV
ncbi:MAG: hypothetical protein HZB24_02095 [Desulfobacterales bacterium]|nr:hypothetical protein [Desulfobacterales bacterium]